MWTLEMWAFQSQLVTELDLDLSLLKANRVYLFLLNSPFSGLVNCSKTLDSLQGIWISVFTVMIIYDSCYTQILTPPDDYTWAVIRTIRMLVFLFRFVSLWAYIKWNPTDFLVYSVTEISCHRRSTEMWENWIISGHTKHRRVRLKRSVPHNARVYISSRCALWSPSLKISISNDSINTNVGSQCALKSGSVLECSNNRISCPLNADEYLQIKEKTFQSYQVTSALLAYRVLVKW